MAPASANTLDLSSSDDQEEQAWADALLAIHVFARAIAQGAFKSSVGIRVKCHAGPVRDAWLSHVTHCLPDLVQHKVPVGVSEEHLIGGLDLIETLLSKNPVTRHGLLATAHQGLLILPMADGLERNIAAQIAMTLDRRSVHIERDGVSSEAPSCFGLIVFDESEPDDEGVAECLNDRLMLHVDLTQVSIRAIGTVPSQAVNSMHEAKNVSLSEKSYEEICGLVEGFGLRSIRPASHVMRVSKILCALRGGAEVEQQDIVSALRLSVLQRAKAIPQKQTNESEEVEAVEPEQAEDSPAEPNHQNNQSSDDAHRDEEDTVAEESYRPPDDILLDALATSLPSGLFEQLRAKADLARRDRSKVARGRSGLTKKASSRGRRLTSRKGELRGGNRLDIISTLRSATPWQTVRRKEQSAGVQSGSGIHIRSTDFHIKRYKQKTGTTCLFVVDASGSTALNRLAETKGAVELLLGESYARRDHVGLISFRGQNAETLLPPTRSLVRAKRALSALPGGGGTPLASGLFNALNLAIEERRQGRSVNIFLMTDGSANVDMSGKGGRAKALEDAYHVAKCIRSEGLQIMLIDVGRQPSERAAKLAEAMDAVYFPMPFASSASLSQAVRQQAG